MAKKYHMSDGEPKECKAKIKCPLGFGTQHFKGEYKDALKWAEQENSKEAGGNMLSSARRKDENSKKGDNLLADNGIRKNDDGRYYSTIDSGHLAGKYYFGSLVESQEDILALHLADVNQDYQNGYCEALAEDLQKTNPNVEDYYYLKTDFDEDFGIHQVAKLKDGTFADSKGIWTHSELEKEWKDVDPSASLTRMPPLEDDPSQGIFAPNPNTTSTDKRVLETVNDIINKRFDTTQ